MSLTNSIQSLRCRLCRNRLLKEYEVYFLTYGEFGLPGEPVLCEHTQGFFYFKNTRYYGEILETAGDLAKSVGHNFKLLAFDDNAASGDLILIDGTFYRVEYVREIHSLCRILELEVYKNAAPN